MSIYLTICLATFPSSDSAMVAHTATTLLIRVAVSCLFAAHVVGLLAVALPVMVASAGAVAVVGAFSVA